MPSSCKLSSVAIFISTILFKNQKVKLIYKFKELVNKESEWKSIGFIYLFIYFLLFSKLLVARNEESYGLSMLVYIIVLLKSIRNFYKLQKRPNF